MLSITHSIPWGCTLFKDTVKECVSPLYSVQRFPSPGSSLVCLRPFPVFDFFFAPFFLLFIGLDSFLPFPVGQEAFCSELAASHVLTLPEAAAGVLLLAGLFLSLCHLYSLVSFSLPLSLTLFLSNTSATKRYIHPVLRRVFRRCFKRPLPACSSLVAHAERYEICSEDTREHGASL